MEEILETYDSEVRLQDSPADNVVNCFWSTTASTSLWAPGLTGRTRTGQPVELELRKFVVKRISKILTDKFFKHVEIEYL